MPKKQQTTNTFGITFQGINKDKTTELERIREDCILVGDYIRTARIKSRYKVKEIAGFCGIDVSKYSRIEGNKTLPSEQELLVIIDVLELDTEKAFILARMLPTKIATVAFTAFKKFGFKLSEILEELNVQTIQPDN